MNAKALKKLKERLNYDYAVIDRYDDKHNYLLFKELKDIYLSDKKNSKLIKVSKNSLGLIIDYIFNGRYFFINEIEYQSLINKELGGW